MPSRSPLPTFLSQNAVFLDRQRRKILIDVSPENLSVSFGDHKLDNAPYTVPLSKVAGMAAAAANEWKCCQKLIETAAAENAVTEKTAAEKVANGMPQESVKYDQGMKRTAQLDSANSGVARGAITVSSVSNDGVAVNVAPTKKQKGTCKPPVSVQISPSSLTGPLSSHGLQVECPSDGGTIRVSSPRSRSPQSPAGSGCYQVENDPAQSVTVRALRDMDIRTQQLKDGVQFRLDGKPGVQLSIRLGESRTDASGVTRNSIKIEAQAVPKTAAPPPESSGGNWHQQGMWQPSQQAFAGGRVKLGPAEKALLSYQRPTVSHLLHARMTELYKEVSRTFRK